MKKFITAAVCALTLQIMASTATASWFRDDSEKERRIEAQRQLTQQQHETSQWQGTAFALGVGCVLMLITGTIIGSRAKRHANGTTN